MSDDVTVMVVDDEGTIVRAVARWLTREGYRVVTSTDPREVLPTIARERVDILISDVDMPQMSGLDLVAQVRRAHPDVVRILLTGNASLGTALQAINEGEVFRFLTKPWEADHLRTVIQDARARRSRVAQESPSVAAERRRHILEDLERDHPGITTVARVDGVYRIEAPRAAELRARVRGTALGAALD